MSCNHVRPVLRPNFWEQVDPAAPSGDSNRRPSGHQSRPNSPVNQTSNRAVSSLSSRPAGERTLHRPPAPANREADPINHPPDKVRDHRHLRNPPVTDVARLRPEGSHSLTCHTGRAGTNGRFWALLRMPCRTSCGVYRAPKVFALLPYGSEGGWDDGTRFIFARINRRADA